MKRFPSRCASAIQIVRPLASPLAAVRFYSGRSQRSSRVRENLEYLIKPHPLESVTNGPLQSSQQEFAAVAFHSLHRCNQRCQTSAIDVSHVGKIDHQTLRLFVDHDIE